MSRHAVVSIARSAWDEIHAHAARDTAHECCGLLIGREQSIVESWPARNVAASPAVRYEIDPQDHFAAVRRARAIDLDVVGAYHSHPRSAPIPSPTDLVEAIADFLYVIVGPTGDAPWQARVFRLREGNFEELTLVTVA
jgi:proteasome lid subunit RPN8/RPN11